MYTNTLKLKAIEDAFYSLTFKINGCNYMEVGRKLEQCRTMQMVF